MPAEPIITISNLSKRYASGLEALSNVSLDIRRGEIFALLGPNGAGKTTLIGIVCGLVNATEGTVVADGHDIVKEYRAARMKIGLVPQELSTDMFETVHATVSFSRGLFGKPRDPAHIEKVLRDLSLWEKRDAKIMTLSGGMKRRVLIAKALSHEPRILFLDEPTAGVDVALRRDMWEMVRSLRETGVTIILTTHYIEEAEEMADRIGVIDKGKLVLVDEKAALMQKLGKRQVVVDLGAPIAEVPAGLEGFDISLEERGARLVWSYHADSEGSKMAPFLRTIGDAGLEIRDLKTVQSSLEDIFLDLVHKAPDDAPRAKKTTSARKEAS